MKFLACFLLLIATTVAASDVNDDVIVSDHYAAGDQSKGYIHSSASAHTKRQVSELARTNIMVFIKGGETTLGTDNPTIYSGIYNDGEYPKRPVYVDDFYLDVYEVSNAEFERFVEATGYVTEAERFDNSYVFSPLLSKAESDKVEVTDNNAPWWAVVTQANWMHPEGIDSDITNRMDHPVFHVSWNDAVAYCVWAQKRLPTEAEWEYACQDSKQDNLFPWGNNITTEGKHRMNYWQGEFPEGNTLEDGYLAAAPVTAYEAQNTHQLKNMVGNAWEWVSDYFSIRHPSGLQFNPKGPSAGQDRVKKGGAFTSAKNICYRYRCAARDHNTPDTTASNISFRCAADKLPSYLGTGGKTADSSGAKISKQRKEL